jgi:phenylpyruvate tautomerase PptA (4-oxalocrotonate tautomerase family)
MLVQIALKSGFSQSDQRKICCLVRSATESSLNVEPGSYFLVVTSEDASAACDGRQRPPPHVLVLVHTGERLTGRTKKSLFGRIMDSFEKELGISRGKIVIGVAEVPSTNWSSAGRIDFVRYMFQ